MTELEKKLLLSKDEYDYLMEHFGYENPLIQKPIVTQINYYFDTDDFAMNQQGTTCRIRLKDGKYKAIMKKHFANTDQSTETEMDIYTGLDNNAFTDMGLKLQGELVTERCIILKNEIFEVALDKNEYLGYTDYELEIEYLPHYEENAKAIMKAFQDMLFCRKYFLIHKEMINALPYVPSKSDRFFKKKIRTKKTVQAVPSDPDDYMRDCFDL